MVSREFPDVTLVAAGENPGAAGGMATGMRTASDRGHDCIWLWVDDTLLREGERLTSLKPFRAIAVVSPAKPPPRMRS